MMLIVARVFILPLPHRGSERAKSESIYRWRRRRLARGVYLHCAIFVHPMLSRELFFIWRNLLPWRTSRLRSDAKGGRMRGAGKQPTLNVPGGSKCCNDHAPHLRCGAPAVGVYLAARAPFRRESVRVQAAGAAWATLAPQRSSRTSRTRAAGASSESAR